MEQLFSFEDIPREYNQHEMWELLSKLELPMSLLINGLDFTPAPNAPITADYEVPLGVSVVTVDASGGAVQITIPRATDSQGRLVYVKKVDTTKYKVTVVAKDGGLIDGRANARLCNPLTGAGFFVSHELWWII